MQVIILSQDKDELALSFSQQITESVMDLRIPIRKSFTLWDEFNPKIYKIGLFTSSDSYETTFGIRQVRAVGRQLYINNRPAYLRGTVENCCFPETGYPPTDEASWISIFTKMKEYGLNHMRFHSYCPPEAAFAAADKMGIYLQPEGPSWPNHGVKLRRGQKIDEYLLEESKRIVDTYGHHPSFVMGWRLGVVLQRLGAGDETLRSLAPLLWCLRRWRLGLGQWVGVSREGWGTRPRLGQARSPRR